MKLAANVRSVLAFLLGQWLVQLCNIASGFLVIRLLSTSDYGTYTICFALIGAAIAASDLGLLRAMTTLAASGGLVGAHQALLETRRVRRPILVGVVGILIAVFYVARDDIGAGSSLLPMAVMTISIVLLEFQSSLARAWLSATHRLWRVTTADTSASVIRVAVLTVSWVTAHPLDVLSALGLMLLTSGISAFALRVRAPPGVRADPSVRVALLSFLGPSLVTAVYMILLGVVPAWMLALNADLETVAEYGALVRLAQAFFLFGALNRFVLHPWLARQKGEDLRSRAVPCIAAVAALNTLIVSSAWVLPNVWLWPLGSAYEHLGPEMLYMLISCGLLVVASTVMAANDAALLTRVEYVAVLVALIMQVLFISVIAIDSVTTAICISLIASLSFLTARLGAFLLYSQRARHYRSVTDTA